MLYYILKYIVYLPFKLLFPLWKRGTKNLPRGGAVLVCNHFSALDIPVLGVNVRRKLHFVAKKEIFRTKIGSWFFRSMSATPINRKNADMADMKEVVQKLKRNKYIMLFPEGTRNKNLSTENFESIKNGAALFALLSGKPIVPMLLEKRPRLLRLNNLIIGKPLYFSDYGLKRADKASLARAGDILKSAMEALIPGKSTTATSVQ